MSIMLTRRHCLSRLGGGIGLAALAHLENSRSAASDVAVDLHHRPTARRVIVLFMGGGPSQIDLFDHKPDVARFAGQELPESVRDGQRLTTMTSGQASLPITPSIFRFARHGQSGAWVSELLPHFANVVDDVCFVRTLATDAINHDPAMTFVQTGHEQPGRPSAGAWVDYGLGSDSEDLPAYVVLHSRWSGSLSPQPIFARLWGSGFLPSRHQGVAFRSTGDPVLYLSNPPGVTDAVRGKTFAALRDLNRLRFQTTGEPEIETRIAQYELAARMQTSVPELTDISGESSSTLSLYGDDVHTPGTFAANCLLARRMVGRGVRFVQVFHRGWDQHGNLPADMRRQCGDVDRPMAGLIRDLKRRGMLDDTLVVWMGEFGRTIYSQGTVSPNNYGRDHHPRCTTMWMAGGGIRGGHIHGVTDDFSYNVAQDRVHVHDLNATILHTLGLDHRRLTYRHQGRDFRLTDVHGEVQTGLLA